MDFDKVASVYDLAQTSHCCVHTCPIITRHCCRHLCSVFVLWEPAAGASVTCCSTCGHPEDPAPENTDTLRNQPGPGLRPADRQGRTSPETSRALCSLKSTEREKQRDNYIIL